METNSALMLSIWAWKKGPFLLLKVISLSPACFWIDAQKLAGQLKCLHLHSDDQNMSLAERQRRKIKTTVMEPWIVNGGPAECHGWCMANSTFYCLGQNGPSWAWVRSYESVIQHWCHTTDSTSCQWVTLASFVNHFTTTHLSIPARTESCNNKMTMA